MFGKSLWNVVWYVTIEYFGNLFSPQFSLIAVSSKQDKQEETKTSGTSEKDSKTDASEK